MKHSLHSPMAPVQLVAETSGQLGTFDTIGVLMDMLRHLPEQGKISLETLVPLITAAMLQGRAHVGVTEDMRPYGFGIWTYVDPQTHERWLHKGPPPLSTLATDDVVRLPVSAPRVGCALLWLLLLVTPFSTPLPYLRVLRTLHPDARSAWGFGTNGGEGVRRLW